MRLAEHVAIMREVTKCGSIFKRGCEDNIQMELKEVGFESMDRI
jgi:hypothetical protein